MERDAAGTRCRAPGHPSAHGHRDRCRRHGDAGLHAQVEEGPAITSGNAATFAVGQAGVSRDNDGVPAAVDRAWPALPSGVTFVDNGNGGDAAGTPGRAPAALRDHLHREQRGGDHAGPGVHADGRAPIVNAATFSLPENSANGRWWAR
jgi:hypothetical protein